MYSAITKYAESSDSEIQLRQTGNYSSDFVCAAVMPVMKRVHASLKQAAETVFCDATSHLDQTNTSLTVLLCGSPIGALPLGAIVSSNQSETAFTEGARYFL